MNLIEIEKFSDLPNYGEYVLVNGIDKNQYGLKAWHVCEMNDLEDGMNFRQDGSFNWLTENGTKIEDVTHWCKLPMSIAKIREVKLKELGI